MSADTDILRELYPSYKRTIVVDFDGVIKCPTTKKPEPGVATALGELMSMGFRIVVSSCRTNVDLNGPLVAREQVEYMREYLEEHKIPFDYVDRGKQGKVVGDYYIDDRGIAYDPQQGMGWQYVVKKVRMDQVENGKGEE